jgi:DNA-binding XRE family transcriptional regulator
MIPDFRLNGINPHIPFFPQFRELLGLSRRELADKLGIHYKTMGDWETRQSSPKIGIQQIKIMTKLLHHVGLTWDDVPNDFGIK